MSSPLKEKAAEAYSKGKFAKAADLYQAYCQAEPKDHQSRVRLGDAWARAGKTARAVAAYREAAEGFAKDGFLPRAIAASKLVLELDPSQLEVQQMLADFCIRRRGAPAVRPPPPEPVPPPARRSAAVEPIALAPASEELELEPAVTVFPSSGATATAQVGEPESEIVIDPGAVETEAIEARGDGAAAVPDEPAEEKVWELSEEDVAPEKTKFDEIELDVEAAAQALWAGPVKQAPSIALGGESLMDAVVRAAELAEPLGDAPALELAESATGQPQEDLPSIPLFSDLDRAAFVALFQRCPLKRVGAGERVVSQGEHGDAFYVICTGRVRVLREENGHTRGVAELGEGAFFGEMALLSGAPRAASVEGAASETQLLEVSAGVLAELARGHPEIGRALKRFGRQRMLANVMETAPLFTRFDRKDRKALAERFRVRDVTPSEALIHEGVPSDGLYVVLAGEVEVRKGDRVLGVLREGELFGEMSLLSKGPAGATVVAKRRGSLLRLPRADFDALIMSHPQILALISELTESRSPSPLD